MNDSNAQLRDRVATLCAWSDVVFKKLTSRSNSRLEYGRWLKLVAEYYLDILNGDGSDQVHLAATQTLVLRTVKKSGQSYSDICQVFRGASGLRSKTVNLRSSQAIRSQYPDATSEQAEALMLRYHLLIKSGGHFLSIYRSLYQSLARSSKLPVLECYASPFNRNLTHYCSLFDEDVHFGACPRFDKFIDTITFPCRLIANPPYTVKAIHTCIEKILKYMSNHNGEFIALLPYLENSADMEELLKSKNTASVLLQGDSYLLHDFITQADLVAPMQLYIVVNVEGSYIKSSEMANNIVHEMRLCAMEHSKRLRSTDVEQREVDY